MRAIGLHERGAHRARAHGEPFTRLKQFAILTKLLAGHIGFRAVAPIVGGRGQRDRNDDTDSDRCSDPRAPPRSEAMRQSCPAEVLPDFCPAPRPGFAGGSPIFFSPGIRPEPRPNSQSRWRGFS
jgi:hypothetical protein